MKRTLVYIDGYNLYYGLLKNSPGSKWLNLRALASFSPMLMRLDIVERRQIIDQARNEERFKLILDAMQDKKFPPQKVFYDGQIYDAFEQMKKFVRTVKTSDKFHDRFLIIDKTTLIHVNAPQKRLRFGGKICRRQTRRAPKRPRASLNHLGKKCFAFSSLDKSNIPDILAKL